MLGQGRFFLLLWRVIWRVMKSIIADPRQSMAPHIAKDFVGLVTKWTFEPIRWVSRSLTWWWGTNKFGRFQSIVPILWEKNSTEGLDVSWSDLLQPSNCRLPGRERKNVYPKYLELKCNFVNVIRRPHCQEWTSLPRKATSRLKKQWLMGPRRKNRQSSTKSIVFLS